VVRQGEPISLAHKGGYARPRNTVAPSISGDTTTVGSVMLGDPGQWLNVGPLVFTWYLNGGLVQSGGVNYTVKTGDTGKTLTLNVGSVNPFGGASATSAGRLL
jgi:hypothetical protein